MMIIPLINITEGKMHDNYSPSEEARGWSKQMKSYLSVYSDWKCFQSSWKLSKNTLEWNSRLKSAPTSFERRKILIAQSAFLTLRSWRESSSFKTVQGHSYEWSPHSRHKWFCFMLDKHTYKLSARIKIFGGYPGKGIKSTKQQVSKPTIKCQVNKCIYMTLPRNPAKPSWNWDEAWSRVV